MSLVERRVRLATASSALGLTCTRDGLSLAGAPLLRKTAAGFEPRPESELCVLLEAAYGGAVQSPASDKSLNRIAGALSAGDLGHAMIAALHLGWPELDWEAGARVARANDTLAKFDPDEPRDGHGRWTSGAAGGAGSSPSASAPTRTQPPAKPKARNHRRHVAAPRRQAPPPVRQSSPKPSPVSPEAAKLEALQTTLRARFDSQTPEQFADQVYRFGDWIERNGAKLSPQGRQLARAEYDFLQGGLQFWLGYKAMPPKTHGRLLSAAVTLYSGAFNSGVTGTSGADRGLPRSFMAAGLASEAFGGASPIPKGRSAAIAEPFAEDMAVAVAQAPRNQPKLAGESLQVNEVF